MGNTVRPCILYFIMPKDYMDSVGSDDEKPEPDMAKDSSENTSLLPKSFFGDKEMEVGASCCVKIVAIHGDEVEVESCGDKEDSNDTKEDDSEDMSGVMGKIDSMAK